MPKAVCEITATSDKGVLGWLTVMAWQVRLTHGSIQMSPPRPGQFSYNPALLSPKHHAIGVLMKIF